MNKFAKLLADADVETVAKLQALASFEIAIAAQRQANDTARIADALDKIVSGTVGRREDEEKRLHEGLAGLFERNGNSSN